MLTRAGRQLARDEGHSAARRVRLLVLRLDLVGGLRVRLVLLRAASRDAQRRDPKEARQRQVREQRLAVRRVGQQTATPGVPLVLQYALHLRRLRWPRLPRPDRQVRRSGRVERAGRMLERRVP